jgi:hypothetical protein
MLRLELPAKVFAAQTTRTYLVAVQGPHDPLYYGLFAALMTDLRKVIPVDGRLLLINSINYAVGVGLWQSIMRSLPVSWLISSQWARANIELVGPVGYRSHSLNHPVGDLLDWFRAARLWRRLQTCNDISELTIDKLLVGDLIIDSYLRFRPSPEFDIADPFVKYIIWQALRDVRRSCNFFKKTNPDLYLSSYSTYIEHGVAVRVAIECGIPVRVYGNLTVFGKRLSSIDAYHTPNTSNYRNDFAALSSQNEAIISARQALDFRLSGGVDTATSYMRVSAYAESEMDVPNVKDEIVVFLHDFYDSPHVYSGLVFSDFWAWITFTIDVLNQGNIGFWIKPHPNQISMSDAAYKRLLNLYPSLRVISPKVTNLQLVKKGMICGVTVYGTVANELAYMGVPSIGCAQHPHHSFDFCRTAHNREQYRSFLLTPRICGLTRDEMKIQALQFFYMHNLHGDKDNLLLREKFTKYFKLVDDKTASVSALSNCLAELRQLPAWKTHLNSIVNEIAATEI